MPCASHAAQSQGRPFYDPPVDESLMELEKSPNRQIVKIPLWRVLEIVPGSLSATPTIALRGGPQWSAHKKLRRVALD
jgi:hypothetical protein